MKIDRDAATHFAEAAAADSSIRRFLIVSYLGSRRGGASWWPQGDWEAYDRDVNHNVLATYYKAKLAADEALYAATKKPGATLVGICLRPGTLTHDAPAGVEFGKTKSVKGNVPRETVAQVADALLAADNVKSGWFDLVEGGEAVDVAVEKAVKAGVDTAEGEPIYKA